MIRLYYSAALYTVLGLAAGLYYRELTRAQDFVGDTQLSVVHTHLLAFGMLFFLVILALEKAFGPTQMFARPGARFRCQCGDAD